MYTYLLYKYAKCSSSKADYPCPVVDLVMIAPIKLQCSFCYTILDNPEVLPHAPNIYR